MGLPIELAIINALQAGKREPYALPRWAYPPLRHALAEALASPEAEHELRRVRRLAESLENEMGSPSAAAALRELLSERRGGHVRPDTV